MKLSAFKLEVKFSTIYFRNAIVHKIADTMSLFYILGCFAPILQFYLLGNRLIVNNQFVLNKISGIPHKTLISVKQIVFVTTFIQSALFGIYANLGFIWYPETTLFASTL